MAEERPDLRALSKLLTAAGVGWLVLFAVANFARVGGTPLGDALAFFGESVFIPFALVLGGRAVGRRAKRDEAAAPPEPKPAPRAPAPPRAARAPAPPSKAAGGFDEIARALGLEGEGYEPGPPQKPTEPPVRAAEKPTAPPVTAAEKPTAPPVRVSGGSRPDRAAPRPEADDDERSPKPKTSEEMVTEARERFAAPPSRPAND